MQKTRVHIDHILNPQIPLLILLYDETFLIGSRLNVPRYSVLAGGTGERHDFGLLSLTELKSL